MAKTDRLLLLVAESVWYWDLLTLIVFRPGKSRRALRLDLYVIALPQVCALAYGLQAAWKARPAYLVASERKIDLIVTNEITPAKLAKAPKEYRRLPALRPQDRRHAGAF